jgi:DNA-binding transcriptional LysR family regulator
VTPTQLRAFACVVRWGSVKGAAGELGVSEAAVSMHVAHLRKELADDLFTRTSSGLAFTPGGLRLASRAVEILGLQDRTVREVSQAGHGRRVLGSPPRACSPSTQPPASSSSSRAGPTTSTSS